MRLKIIILIFIVGIIYFFQGAFLNSPQKRISTTDPKIAIRNLNSQISSATKLVEKNPDRDDLKRTLFSLISTKITFLGNYNDFKILEKLVSTMEPGESAMYYQAKYQSIIHEFKHSNELINTRKTKSSLIHKLKISNDLALNKNLESIKEELLKNKNNHSNYLTLAEIESELGNFNSADNYYEKAFEAYRDTSPFVPAYLFFRRGVMWGEKYGDEKKALTYYNEAIHYLPQYVTAQVHRAELLNKDMAIKALQSVLSSYDPEPKGVLAEIYLSENKTEKAKDLILQAQERYQELLQNYEKAFADHASEFFANPGGNPKKSLELAKLNYENRKTQRATLLLIESSISASDKNGLCSLLKSVEKNKFTNVLLKNEIDKAKENC